jgi:hypothetical protein
MCSPSSSLLTSFSSLVEDKFTASFVIYHIKYHLMFQ